MKLKLIGNAKNLRKSTVSTIFFDSFAENCKLFDFRYACKIYCLILYAQFFFNLNFKMKN